MLELKHRFGGHGGIPTEWEIRVGDDFLLDYPSFVFKEGIIRHYPTINDHEIKKIILEIPQSLWPIQSSKIDPKDLSWKALRSFFEDGWAGIDLPQGVEDSEAQEIVASLMVKNTEQLHASFQKILERVCERCHNCLKITDYVHSCIGNNYNMDMDSIRDGPNGIEVKLVEPLNLYSGCLECDDYCAKCKKV